MEDQTHAVQGKVTGVIIPPPQIRALVDKTAQYVAKNGKGFEEKILNSAEGRTPKFSFLQEYDPYHPYYEFKIREFEEGGRTEPKPVTAAASTAAPAATATAASSSNSAASSGEKPAEVAQGSTSTNAANAANTTYMKASFVNPLAKFAMNKPTEAPPAYEFLIDHPLDLSQFDTDIIKLTAQFTALNGREFLGGIAQREQRNPQFDFLKPTHMLFPYFTSLVDSYSKILTRRKQPIAELFPAKSKMELLEQSVNRWEWNKQEAEKKRRDEMEANNEKVAFSAVDWSDFIVVQTIDFPEHEVFYETPIPTQDILAIAPHVGPASTGPSAMPPPPPSAAMSANEDMDVDMEEDSDIKVVSDYVPRTAQSISSGSAASKLMVDPISGKAIPAEQMEEHMRVQLLDPKWRQEQKRFQEKQKDTGFAEGASIAESLKQFAKKRGDIFGREEEPSQPSAPVGGGVQWDGHQGTAATALQLKAEIVARQPTSTPIVVSSAPSIGPSLGPGYVMPPSTNPAMSSLYTPPAPATYVRAPPPPPAMSLAPAASYAPAPMMPPPPPSVSMASYAAAMPPPPPPLPAVPMATPLPPPPLPSFSQGVSMPPPPPPSMPMPAPVSAPVEPAEEKKENLIAPEEFAANFPGEIELTILCPVDASAAAATWGLRGQSLIVTLPSLWATAKDLKEKLSGLLGDMPANKQQLKTSSGSFLKDALSLAAANVAPGSVLELSVRSRGGKK